MCSGGGKCALGVEDDGAQVALVDALHGLLLRFHVLRGGLVLRVV